MKNESRGKLGTLVIAFRSGRFDGRFSLISSSPPFLPAFYIYKEREVTYLGYEQELQHQLKSNITQIEIDLEVHLNKPYFCWLQSPVSQPELSSALPAPR
jgi:hypothetical protein